MEEKIDEQEMFFLIRELVKIVRVFQNEKTICEDVTFSQFCILDFIMERGELPLAELHDLLAVEKSTTTRLVRPLVNKKLVKRHTCCHDSRALNLSVTAEGREKYLKMQSCLAQFVRQVLEQIPAEEKRDVMAGVALFIKSISQCCT